jgi:hypothetical protein
LWTHIGAGIAGAAGGLLLFLLLWFGGALPGNDASPDLGPQFAAMQKQVKELSDRPAPPPGVDPKALDAIAARLAKVESAQAAGSRAPTPDPAVTNRLTAIESALKTAADNLAALSRRMDGEDGALRDANARLEKLTGTLAEVQAAARESHAGTDRVSRFAAAAAALLNAVEHGEPFKPELDIVKPFAPDAPELAALEPFALSGLPNDAAIARELSTLIRPMMAKSDAPPPTSGGFLDRLQANAEKLVRIRPVDEARGDDRDARLARLEQRATQGNVAGAMDEIARLPTDARAPFQNWVAKVQARDKAIEAARHLSSAAVAALKPAP